MKHVSRLTTVVAAASALVIGAAPMATAAEGNPYTGPAYEFVAEGGAATTLAPAGYHKAQPFVAEIGGSLTSASVEVSEVAADTTVSATIYEDDGFPTLGDVVASDTVAVVADGMVTLTFGAGALVKGGAYVLRFSVDEGSVLLLVDSDPDGLAPNYWGYDPGFDYWGESPGFSIVGEVTVSGTDVDDPTVTGVLTPAAPDGTNGWYVTNPILQFQCSDVTTVVVDCAGGGVIQEGEYLLEYTATDLAGNSGSMTPLNVKVDTVDPTFTFAPGREPNGAGWYMNPVVVDLVASDATSGVAPGEIPGKLTTTTDLEWTVYDNAGNSRTKLRTFKVDTRDPSVRIPGLTPGEEFRRVPDLGCGASDGTGKSASGVVSCRTTIERLDGAKYLATAVAKDKAGNRAQDSVRFVVT